MSINFFQNKYGKDVIYKGKRPNHPKYVLCHDTNTSGSELIAQRNYA